MPLLLNYLAKTIFVKANDFDSGYFSAISVKQLTDRLYVL